MPDMSVSIREGHLNPKTMKEVMVETDTWEVSLAVDKHGNLTILVSYDGDHAKVALFDMLNGEAIPTGDDTDTFALKFMPTNPRKPARRRP